MIESLLVLSHCLGDDGPDSDLFMLSIAACESVKRSTVAWGGITKSPVHIASSSALVEDGQLIVATLP